MTARKSIAGSLLLGLLGLTLSGCGGGHQSPEAVFNAAKAAAQKQDYRAFCDCLTEDSRDQMAAGLAMMAVMFKGFGQFGGQGLDMKPLDEALSKHGLTEEVIKKMDQQEAAKGVEGTKQAIKKMLEPVKDRNAFIADVMTAMNKVSKGKDDDPFLLPSDSELKDLKIEGDTAKGLIVHKGGAGKSAPIQFRKIGGGWRIEFPSENMGLGG